MPGAIEGHRNILINEIQHLPSRRLQLRRKHPLIIEGGCCNEKGISGCYGKTRETHRSKCRTLEGRSKPITKGLAFVFQRKKQEGIHAI